MLNSKFDINSPEWIDRVFENRNKSYGAYDLRKHYTGNLFRALGITLLALAAVFGVSSYVMSRQPASVGDKKVGVNVDNKSVKVEPVHTKITDASSNTPLKLKDVDVKPSLIGGAETWKDFLEKNLRYPEQAKSQRLTGTVLTSFVIERNGQISNIHIDQPAGHGFDEEALRVLNLSPVWAPGQLNGQTVRVRYILPINFRIEHR
jgi:protein TonB